MQFQTNPYLVWQLIPAGITTWLAIRIHRKHSRRNELILLEIMMFAAAFWALMNAIQLASPDASWQDFWHKASFLAIVLIPTAWFLLSINYSRIFLKPIQRIQGLFYILPAVSLWAVLTNADHHFFFSSSRLIQVDGFSSLIVTAGPLFLVHLVYSYTLLALGVGTLGWAMFRNIRKFGAQAFGLAFGVLLPLVLNILYILNIFPPGFPDPTPISFTITAITFALVILSSRILDVVPIAHESIVSNLSLGILVLDMEKRVLEINQAARQVLGINTDDLLNQPLDRIVEDDPILLHNLQEALDIGNGKEQQVNILSRSSQRTFNVIVSAILDNQGIHQGFLLQFADISRQKLVEKNLADSREMINSILDTLQDYYFETDARGNILDINRAFYTHLGYSSKDELVGKNFRHFTTRESARTVLLNFKKLYETGKTLTLFRYQYHTRDGRTFMGETTVSPIFEGDVVVGARGVLRNITEQVAAEEDLRQAKEEAESRVNDLTAINRIASISTSSLDLDKILQSLCIELTRMFRMRNASINLADPERSFLQTAAYHSVEPEEMVTLGSSIPLKDYAAWEQAINKGQTVIFSPLTLGAPPVSSVKSIGGVENRSSMIIPIKTRAGTLGTIDLAGWNTSRTFDQNEITLAETIAYQVAAAIDNAQLYRKTENALGDVEQDMEIGQQVQADFFPEEIPDIPGWEFAAHFEPSRRVAGDFYDFFKFEHSNMMAVVISDVCDKGIGAALFMVLFRSLLRAYSRVEVNEDNVDQQLKRIISRTNDYIAEIHAKSSMFATIFLGILDPDSGTLHYVNGGHEPPVIMNKDGKIVKSLLPTGPAVGVIPQAEYRVEKVVLEMGDFLMGYTDGTIDARSERDEVFTKERLLNYIQYPWSSLFSMVFEIRNELHRFAGARRQFDDITMISMRRRFSQEQGKQSICREARLEYLDELGEFVEASLVHCKLQSEPAQVLRKAAEQACGSIIRNGFEHDDAGVLSIVCEKNEDKARLIIRDDGKPIGSPRAEAEAASADGTAVSFWQTLLEDPEPVQIVSYDSMNGGGNQLVLEMAIRIDELQEISPEGMPAS